MNSADIEKALNIIRSRYEGVILGSEGRVIETNIASSEQLAEEKGLSSADISAKINQFFIKNQYAYGGAATTDFLSIMMDIIRKYAYRLNTARHKM